ncbi:hypothetical protein Tco_1497457, partial [Tanacetum coccineum]
NDNDQGDGDERIDLDNDGDDFVHPKFSTHDEEDSFDPRVQISSYVESTDDEDNNKEIRGANVEGDKQDEEETNEEVEANELYKDVNINLEGRDIKITNAQQTNVQPTQVIEDTYVIITAPVNPEGQQQSSSVSSGFISNMLNPSPDICIDSIFNLNTESTSLVDVLVTAIAKPPLLSITTTPPPPTPLITHLQQTPAPTLAIVSSSSIQDLPNFVVSSIPGIIDLYIANQMNDADQVKVHVKDQVSKILPQIEKLVNDQIEAKVLIRSSNESKTSHVVAANLFELELKKILIDKMESNKSIH